MATDSDVNNQPIEIDPNFFLPPSVVDARYKDPDVGVQSWEYGDEFGDTGVVETVESPQDPQVTPIPTDLPALSAPTNITILSQTVTVKPDGSWSVDVVMDVEPYEGGVTSYESRIMIA
jgi:hypothetical protein